MRPIRILLACLLAGALVGSPLALAPAASAKGEPVPASFDVESAALPVLVAASVPSALPLDVAAGLGYSGAKLNSQPKGTAQASPGYVPIAGALPLLGGPGALPNIALRLLPGLLFGFPTVVGLPPIPVDPTLIPAPNLPPLPIPPLPPIECFASVPGDPDPISCGGGTQDILGFKLSAASGTVSAQGDIDDKSTLRVDAAVRGAGFDSAASNALLPISAGAVASSANSYISEGRVVTGVSTAVSDLSIFGAIKIPSIKTSISAALDGTPGRASIQGERCTIAGATIAGVPVTIDGDGVHVVTQNQPLDDLLNPVNKLVQDTLTQLGVTLKTFSGPADPGTGKAEIFPGQSSISEDGTKLSAALSCLQVGYAVPASGTVLTLTFGSATVAMQAFTEAAVAGAAPTTTSGDAGSGSDGLSAPSIGGDGSSASIGLSPPPPPAPIAGDGAPAPSSIPFEEVGFGWELPYPPFAILALALPLVIWSRRLGTLRLPRPPFLTGRLDRA